MSFLGIGFVGEDLEESRKTVKALQNQLKQADRTIENLREQLEDTEHETYRSHRLELREEREENEDEARRVARSNADRIREIQDECEGTVRENNALHQKDLDGKDKEIATLKSQVRELELQLEEEAQDADLAIQEGILDYKESHLSEVNEKDVKIARLEGDIKAAKAEADAKGIVIKALESSIESVREDMDSMIEFASEVAPKISLEKFNINVEVPAPVSVQQKGGNNEQKKN